MPKLRQGLRRTLDRASGHVWTLAPVVRHQVLPLAAPPSKPWSLTFDEPGVGSLELNGLLSNRAADGTPLSTDRMVVLVHGLGGSVTSYYMLRAAWAALDMGLPVLRLNLRGADRTPSDFYHAGLTSDFARAVASPELAVYQRIDLVGFSLGGHTLVKYAAEVEDPRVGAIGAISAPLDLRATVDDFDAQFHYPYRGYILHGIIDMFVKTAEGRNIPGFDPEHVASVRTLRAFDRAAVVPRWGFDDEEHYYRTQSAGRFLDALRRPTILVSSESDPMISARSVRSGLQFVEPSPLFHHVWVPPGGHVGFPPGVDVDVFAGDPSAAGNGQGRGQASNGARSHRSHGGIGKVVTQVLRWMAAR